MLCAGHEHQCRPCLHAEEGLRFEHDDASGCHLSRSRGGCGRQIALQGRQGSSSGARRLPGPAAGRAVPGRFRAMRDGARTSICRNRAGCDGAPERCIRLLRVKVTTKNSSRPVMPFRKCVAASPYSALHSMRLRYRMDHSGWRAKKSSARCARCASRRRSCTVMGVWDRSRSRPASYKRHDRCGCGSRAGGLLRFERSANVESAAPGSLRPTYEIGESSPQYL